MNGRAIILALVMPVARHGVGAQVAERRDTLRLHELQDAAARIDPRGRELALQRQATALRLRTIRADRLPALNGEGYGQYQSVVVALPFQLPNVPFSGLPHDTYDAHLLAQQRLYDPSLTPRADAERARSEERRVGKE